MFDVLLHVAINELFGVQSNCESNGMDLMLVERKGKAVAFEQWQANYRWRNHLDESMANGQRQKRKFYDKNRQSERKSIRRRVASMNIILNIIIIILVDDGGARKSW